MFVTLRYRDILAVSEVVFSSNCNMISDIDQHNIMMLEVTPDNFDGILHDVSVGFLHGSIRWFKVEGDSTHVKI